MPWRIFMHLYSKVRTGMGDLWVGFSSKGVAFISRAAEAPGVFEASYQKRFGLKPLRGKIPASYVHAVQNAAAGRPFDPVSIDLSNLSEFHIKVLKKLKTVPRGEVRPYAWLAREAGKPGAMRAVGNIMARNPVPILIPCHRVVPTSGGIGNYGLGSALKRELLSREGAPIDEMENLGKKGVRYIGSRVARIYCFPTCPRVRSLKPVNRIPFINMRDAQYAGFRPCRRCRPATDSTA
jgi:O-6-methylguanine DNA methyltransferase